MEIKQLIHNINIVPLTCKNLPCKHIENEKWWQFYKLIYGEK
jgi:hypothetical protein